VILLILAYFTEGLGFVVQGTFLPDIINSLEGLERYGNLGWLIGQVGAPLYSVALIDYFGNYASTLYVTAFIVFIGI